MALDNEEAIRVGLAAVKADSDDDAVREEGITEIIQICNEGLEHHWPYRVLGNLLIGSGKVSEWRNAMHCVVSSAQYPDHVFEHSKDERYSRAYNLCMELSINLRKADMHEEATECFIMAGRYYWSIEEDRTDIEEFDRTFVDYAFECAEEADDDKDGPMTRKVFDFIEELRE